MTTADPALPTLGQWTVGGRVPVAGSPTPVKVALPCPGPIELTFPPPGAADEGDRDPPADPGAGSAGSGPTRADAAAGGRPWWSAARRRTVLNRRQAAVLLLQLLGRVIEALWSAVRSSVSSGSDGGTATTVQRAWARQ